jgi:hypothetical protein
VVDKQLEEPNNPEIASVDEINESPNEIKDGAEIETAVISEPEDDAADDPVQDIADDLANTIQGAFESLVEGRDAQLAAETAALEAEEATLRQESATIAEAAGNLGKIIPATARQAQREADKLLLDGRVEEAEAKIAEAKQAADAHAAMEKRREEINARFEEIASERKVIATRIFGVWYGGLQKITRTTERVFFLSLLDRALDEMNNYSNRHGLGASDKPYSAGIVTRGRIDGLTSDERDKSPVWFASQRWYGTGQ